MKLHPKSDQIKTFKSDIVNKYFEGNRNVCNTLKGVLIVSVLIQTSISLFFTSIFD